ncbi:MAG: hypothetical protein RLZZ591_31 [Pseudomonadota bacterium]
MPLSGKNCWGRWRLGTWVMALRRMLLACVTAGACIGALSACAWLDEQQRRAIYRPTPAPDLAFDADAEGDRRYFLPVPGSSQQLELWWYPNPRPSASTLLYLHGTLRHLGPNRAKILALREAGFSVLALDYRGWGRSSIMVPTQQSLVADAKLAWQKLVDLESRPGRRVIFGHSLGGAVAVALASELEQEVYVGLILESTFSSLHDLARRHSWFAAELLSWTHERFESVSVIPKVTVPLLIMHGSADDTVPAELGFRLFGAANPPKQWVLIPGGTHSALQVDAADLYRKTVHDFLDTPRPPR